MHEPYGLKRTHHHQLIPLQPTEGSIVFPFSQPPKVYHDRSSKCLGCPYPRHGLMCWSKDDGSCLRTDMQTLEWDR